MNEPNPLVSVALITYNQEEFIKECLDGIVNQQTTFNFEIVISDDCSKDHTRDICVNYKEKYPNTIRLEFPEKNLGVMGNWIHTISSCKGKYIAICEGDDYWTDPNKLQKQVDFMESNPDYWLVYHKVNELWQESGEIKPETINTSNEEITYTISDLSKGNFIHTPSVLIRNNNLNFTKLQQLSTVIDYYLWMICAKNGKIKFLPQIMAIYRVSNSSTWALKSENFRISNWIIMLAQLLGELENDTDTYSVVLFQIKEYFKRLYNESNRADHNDIELLDSTTKKIMLLSSDFQFWWFNYMLIIRTKRLYRLKYYFYLINNRSLSSIWLLKKCLF